MEQVKTYVEYLYPSSKRNYECFEVQERNPKKYYDNNVTQFRFFDLVDDSFKRENVSNWFCNGIRISSEYFKECFGKIAKYANFAKNIEEKGGFSWVCLTADGDILPMYDGDISLVEYLSLSNKENTLDLKRLICQLTRMGLSHIKTELGELWQQYVERNIGSELQTFVISRIIVKLIALDEGVDLETLKKNNSWYYDDGLNLAELEAISFFSKRGEEYKRYFEDAFGSFLLDSNINIPDSLKVNK